MGGFLAVVTHQTTKPIIPETQEQTAKLCTFDQFFDSSSTQWSIFANLRP